MIVATTDSIPGKTIVKTLGLVRGNTIRARHIGRDLIAGLKGVVGDAERRGASRLRHGRDHRGSVGRATARHRYLSCWGRAK